MKENYSCYPGIEVKNANKTEIYCWCKQVFGPMRSGPNETVWTLSSNYNERPHPLNPFMFCTNREDYLMLFKLKWGSDNA